MLEPTAAQLRLRIREYHRKDEAAVVMELAAQAGISDVMQARIVERARPLVEKVRAARTQTGGIDAFLNTYDLSSREGIVLMCLAEALLRIPDAETADRLIRDKIGSADWAARLGASHNLFVNASTWALMLTGRFINLDHDAHSLSGTLKHLVVRAGEPVIRQAILAAMRILGKQFVMGRTIAEAIERARDAEQRDYRHSYDMLGEAARTARDAQRHFEAYSAAIAAIGVVVAGRPIHAAPSISIKLSALHPRFEATQQARVMNELAPAVKALALKARQAGIGFTIDAEEADRLEISLDLIEALALDPELAGWDGLGLAVQAYQKRALPLIDWLAHLARRGQRRLLVRLVKGAYWDTEIKLTQERGLDGYPVFTRKENTDVSYLACARQLLADPLAFYPAFATHNAHTLCAVAELAHAAHHTEWEYQRLHGMGEELYDQIVGARLWNRPCRVYAPVGSHEDLLAYLVRRLLENGANTSFVNRIADAEQPIDALLTNPIARILARPPREIPHPRIPHPRDLYRSHAHDPDDRLNSEGLDMHDEDATNALRAAIARSQDCHHTAMPIIGGIEQTSGTVRKVACPANRHAMLGSVIDATPANAAAAMRLAHHAHPQWDALSATTRADLLERAAQALQDRLAECVALIVLEGGRTQADAVSEVREAIDFCRYYAREARVKFAEPIELPGPTGEKNTLQLAGRGVFVCISPWNFPLAIFIGQIAAALAAGNTVVAKPAEQTPLVGALAVRLMHAAGIPGDVLHCLPGDGRIGAALVNDPHCRGVAFTGSTEVARLIAQALAARPGPLVPLIAETGGQNALIADSSALPEQVVRDVIASAFNSAGQRCSALRILCVQNDIADKVIDMLKGAMRELVIGDPVSLTTDVGPVIDEEARASLMAHVRELDRFAKLLCTCDMDEAALSSGVFFAPRAYEIDYEIDRIDCLGKEVFGPILHVLRWQAGELDALCDALAATGYGLTLGIHSRIDSTIARITQRLHVGNTYVNRNMIGAVVGVQPFGGEGLSGTGPKAGGPHYLYRFATERTISIDTTAAGGNASLISMEDGND